MEDFMKKMNDEMQKQKQQLVDHMYRRTFNELFLNYSEYVKSSIDIKLKLKLLNSMETYFVDLEEYEKCEIIMKVKNKINENNN